MSDDRDELGGYDPTTPYKPQPASKKRKAPISRPAAGPSTSKPASKGTVAKKKASRVSPALIGDDDDDDGETGPSPPPPKSKGRLPVNGRASSKENGKGRAEPQANSTRGPSPMVVDESEDEPTVAAPVVKQTKRTVAVIQPKKEDMVSRRELERLRKQLQDVTSQRDQLTNQMKELMSIRQTEPEEELQIQASRYESKANAQEELIRELTSQLARVDPLIKAGRTSTLHFLTREAANEEKRNVEGEVERLKGLMSQKDDVIAQKNQHIRELQQQEQQTQLELKAEIERNKLLLSKPPRDPPGSALRGRPGRDMANDPKNGATVRLYEDMTNLLVTNVKFETCEYLDLEDCVFLCVFTHSDMRSLTFTLTLTWVPKDGEVLPITSKEQLLPTVRYRPMELDKEHDEYVQKLEFLGDSFTFTRDQLDVFMKTLNDQLGGGQDTVQQEDELA
ncbi:hypothetical protein FA95DRAFT_1551627 [Auriscalpium vulgare]|uniref:Uncharacterized protein n=1 Tax=Auriscalpium vulgare TaxID=40419 RepID=A0ACB8SCB5_9AGAM|nr:hypothetical protein FA95DRAFT_1551627 [Auriscalpium vulgare]